MRRNIAFVPKFIIRGHLRFVPRWPGHHLADFRPHHPGARRSASADGSKTIFAARSARWVSVSISGQRRRGELAVLRRACGCKKPAALGPQRARGLDRWRHSQCRGVLRFIFDHPAGRAKAARAVTLRFTACATPRASRAPPNVEIHTPPRRKNSIQPQWRVFKMRTERGVEDQPQHAPLSTVFHAI